MENQWERGIKDMTTATNGVNVQALLDAREVLKGAPEAAQFTWRASAKWQSGVHSTIKVQSFFGLGEEQSHKEEWTFEADHPEVFAAEDDGITPIEYLIVGLASCLTGGIASVAENRGIQLRSVESVVEGGHDIRGILGADSDVRNGFNDIKVTFTIDADASRQEIEALVAQSRSAPRSTTLSRTRRTSPSKSPERPRGGLPARALRKHRGAEPSSASPRSSSARGTRAGRQLLPRANERSIDHVVLERGEVANSWQRERWVAAAAHP